ncbi:acyltransferase [Bradyrhizobium daqingense]|uniref:Peptidoglycan/LPS O-acetylase OafA/YrhL n=1 Tax=Bradyrhizobium daqingense TaxID=993502 RepID=A0A562LLN4_9BRAD|nr:acyltransferase [Bradyrhizobium daqingense]TWI08540.1 peptidoglycan/LPS O-acetylase OafA/YrhL [Bradyrhizobium daqingense]UFS87528.1 acyltransferase [Bradyrhizobium daqingense]
MGILRFFLAAWVAGGHAALFSIGQTMPNPAAAVIVFFAISGFLMTTVLTRPQSERWISSFYLSRALRIFPLYWITLLVTIVFGTTAIVNTSFGPVDPFGNILEYWDGSGLVARSIIVFANLTTVLQDVLRRIVYIPSMGDFDFYPPYPADPIQGLSFNIIGQAWSLGPEILFYLAAPFFVRQAERVIGVLLLCAAARVTNGDVMYIHYAPAFLTGVLLAHMKAPPRILILSAAALSLAMTIGITPDGKALVALLILSIPFAAMVRFRIDTFLGDMSYPLYITHFLVFQACASADHREVVTAGAMLAVALVATLAVEHPLKRYRHGMSPSQATFADLERRAPA